MEPYLIFLYFREWWKGTEVCVCVYDSPIIPGAVLVSSAHPLQPLCALPPASCSLNSHRQKCFFLLLVFVILIVQRIVSPHTHFPFLARLVDRCVLTHELQTFTAGLTACISHHGVLAARLASEPVSPW